MFITVCCYTGLNVNAKMYTAQSGPDRKNHSQWLVSEFKSSVSSLIVTQFSGNKVKLNMQSV